MGNDFTPYGLLADIMLVVHAAYILFVVGGQLLILVGWIAAWTWTRHLIFRVAHLAAIGFVIIEVWTGFACPLTVLENVLRERAGQGVYEVSFIGYWLQRILFYDAPGWVFTLMYTAFGALVLLTFIAYPPRRRRG